LQIKLSDYIFSFLENTGLKHVFLLPGGGSMHLVDSLGRSSIEYVANLHEQAAAIAAEAYAQYTNNVGVALVTTGPGSTNAVTGVAGAWIESSPCLFLSGQVKRADLLEDKGVRQMGVQEVDIVSIVRPITKYAATIMEPNTVRYNLEKAFYMAKSGRPGPVWLAVPLDVQAAIIETDELPGFDPEEMKENDMSSKGASLSEKAAAALELLNRGARRPVILLGNGVRLSGAQKDVYKLVDRLKAPVLTTWKTIDFFPHGHPYNFGRPGSIGQRPANFILQNCDFLLSLGARLDLAQVGYSYENLARGARKIIVDIDQAEINKISTNIDLPVCADAGQFIRCLLEKESMMKDYDWTDWLEQCRDWTSKYPVMLTEYWEERDYVNIYALVDEISKKSNSEDVLVPGSSGSCSEVVMQSYKVKEGQRILNTQGFGAMGFGLPASIGACLASGRRRTICINGDGGFQLNIQELETIARLDLPIKIFIINNQGYGSIRATQRNYFQGRYVCSSRESGLTLPDLVEVASAYKIKAFKIKNNYELKDGVEKALALPGPVLCDVMISPDQPTMPRISSMQRKDGTMCSKPLEDLWPFLSREEFLGNMIVPPIKDE
jgi:acetolactate synthase-1/2/3 large subunit